MAIHYNGGTNFSAYSNANIDATQQLSFSHWFRKDVTSSFDRHFHLSKSGSQGFMIAQDFNAGTTINVFSSQASGNWGLAGGTLQANTTNLKWHHVCGTVSVSDGSNNKTLESAYYNGVLMTDTSSQTASPGSNSDTLSLARRTDGGSFYDGSLGEAAIWEGLQLTAEEALALAAGAPATSIRAHALKFYTPMHTPDGVDLIAGVVPTPTAAFLEEHPPVTQIPQSFQVISEVVIPPAGGRIMGSLANIGGLAGAGGLAGPGGGLAG